jgi:hypothetical protein
MADRTELAEAPEHHERMFTIMHSVAVGVGSVCVRSANEIDKGIAHLYAISSHITDAQTLDGIAWGRRPRRLVEKVRVYSWGMIELTLLTSRL